MTVPSSLRLCCREMWEHLDDLMWTALRHPLPPSGHPVDGHCTCGQVVVWRPSTTWRRMLQKRLRGQHDRSSGAAPSTRRCGAA